MKKIAALFLTIFLAAGVASAETAYLIEPETGDYRYIISQTGEILYQTESILSTVSSEMGLFTEPLAERMEDGEWVITANALVRADGTRLTDYIEGVYFEASLCNDQVLVWHNDKYGVFDSDGTEIFPCEYAVLADAGEGKYFALKDELCEDSETVFFLSTEDRTVSPTEAVCGEWRWLQPVSDGRIPAVDRVSGRYGYLDAEDGSWAIAPAYADAESFTGGLAVVSADGLNYGVIGLNGERKTELKYQGIQICETSGTALCAIDGENYVIFDTGTWEEIARLSDKNRNAYQCENGYIRFYDETVVTTYDAQGNFLSEGDIYWNACYDQQGNVTGECIRHDYSVPDSDMICDAAGNEISGPYTYVYCIGRFAGETLFSSYDSGTEKTHIIDSLGAYPFGTNCVYAEVLNEDLIYLRLGDCCQVRNSAGEILFELSDYLELLD